MSSWADQAEEAAAAAAAAAAPAAPPAAAKTESSSTDSDLAKATEKLKLDKEASGTAAGAAAADAAHAAAHHAVGGGMKIGSAVGALQTYMDIKGTDMKIRVTDKTSPLHSVKSFDELAHMENTTPIPPGVLKGLYEELQYQVPTKIQEAALPLLLKNPVKSATNPLGKPENMIFQSQAGTGKTGAFAITMLSRADPALKSPQCICIAPTFNLCMQTKNVIETMATHANLEVACHYGGGGPKAPPLLARGEKITAQILIITPGKLAQYLQMPAKRRPLEPKNFKVFVLDEADHLIDENFRDDMITIKKFLPEHVQYILLSATFKEEVLTFAESFVPQPCNTITLPRQEVSLDNVKQFFVNCQGDIGKFEAVESIYDNVRLGQTIIFCERRRTAEHLAAKMTEAKHVVGLLHGGMDKSQQDAVLNRFRKQSEKVLITTNVLARGIDVPQVSMVVNYDVPVKAVHQPVENPRNPPDPATYLHRIGRTGRLNKRGVAISLVDTGKPHELAKLKEIEAYWSKPIEELVVEDEDNIKDKVQVD